MSASSSTTWRVRGIHTSCVRTCLQAMAVQSTIRVHSLALEVHGRSQTATITLANDSSTSYEPQLPIRFHPCAEHPSTDRDDQRQGPVVDKDFLGLTTLYAPQPDHHKIDILVVSGLGGHAFGSFKEHGGDHMWLRDALPNDIKSSPQHEANQSDTTGSHPMARIIIFGYSSPIANSESVQNVHDLAGQLRSDLSAVVSGGTHLIRSPRPLVVLSHSLGGLVMKQVLISIAASEDASARRIRGCLHSLVFFGVPHLGMKNESLRSMAGLHGLNEELILSIGDDNSGFLSDQKREFSAALDQLGELHRRPKVFCYYETAVSPTAVRIGGEWKRQGAKVLLVSVSSATDCIPHADKREHQCSINRSHSEMVKYSHEDPVYYRVRDKLQALCTDAVYTTTFTPVPDPTSAPDLCPKVTTMIPMPRNKNFTGRESVLKRLGKMCFSTGAGTPVILVGLGGMGKTQITLEFSYWVQEEMPGWSIFWVSALSMDTFTQSCSEIVRKLGLAKGQEASQARDVRELFKEYLSRGGEVGKWLLVVDNADDIHLVREMRQYIPHNARGITLVTSRYEAVGWELSETPRLVNLDIMSVDEGRRLLQKLIVADRVPDYNDDSTAQLLEAVEMLPLAIAQAAAYLSRNRLSIREYLDLLQGREEEARQLLKHEASSAGQWPQARQEPKYNAALTTWLVSLEQILRDEGSTDTGRGPTVELLMLLSRVEPKAIPKAMLSDIGGAAEVVQTSTVGTLLQYGLLTKREGDMYDMHSLVHLAIRAWVSDRQLSDDATTKALKSLADKMDCGDGAPDYEIRNVCLDYLPHAMRVLAECQQASEARYSLTLHVVLGLWADGQWNAALKWMRAAAEDVAAVFGPDSEDSMWAQCNLVNAYLNAGQSAAALPLAKALVAQLQTRPDSNEWRVRAQTLYAQTLRRSGRHRRAVKVLDQVAPLLRTDHSGWADVHIELATAHRSNGEPDRAIPIFEHVLAVLDARQDLDANDVQSADRARHNLALAYIDSNKPSAALTLLQPLLTAAEAQYPPHHPGLLSTRVATACALLDVGEPAKALHILQDVVDMLNKPHAANGIGLASARLRLGQSLLAMAKVDQAVDLLECSIQSCPSETFDDQAMLRDLMSLLRDVYEALSDRDNVIRLDQKIDETDTRIDELESSASEFSDEEEEPGEAELPSEENSGRKSPTPEAAKAASNTPTPTRKLDKLKVWFKRRKPA